MGILIGLFFGVCIGIFIGVFLMALMAVSEDEELKRYEQEKCCKGIDLQKIKDRNEF